VKTETKVRCLRLLIDFYIAIVVTALMFERAC
jgi:hypothetical protein